MRLALPVFGDAVAPRFCSAGQLLLVEVAEGAVVPGRRVELGERDFVQRLGLVRDLGVTHLLCGGFNRSFLPLAEGMGIAVVWGLWGDPLRVAADFVAGRLARDQGRAFCGAGRRRRRRAGPPNRKWSV